MNIQQSLNAALTMGGVIATQTPQFKAQQLGVEIGKIDKASKVGVTEAIEKSADKGEINLKAGQADVELLTDKVEKAKARAEKDPKYTQEWIDAQKELEQAEKFQKYQVEAQTEQTEYEQLEQNKKDLAAGKYQAFTKQAKAESDAKNAYDTETNNQRNIKKGMKDRKGIVSAKAAGKALDDVFKNLGGKK